MANKIKIPSSVNKTADYYIVDSNMNILEKCRLYYTAYLRTKVLKKLYINPVRMIHKERYKEEVLLLKKKANI